MSKSGEPVATEKAEKGLRADKWLWYARFFKSRSLAAKACQSGKVKIDKETLSKANAMVKIGNVLTFEQSRHIRVVKVLVLGNRRGPAPEAQLLFEDLSPPRAQKSDTSQAASLAPAIRETGTGRPTKRERRDMEKLRSDRF